MAEAPQDRVCDECGRWVEPNESIYRMRVELCADPGPVDLPARETIGDVQTELEALIRRLESMTSEQVDEATSQIHELFDFQLCPGCRRAIRDQMKQRLRVADHHSADS